MKKKILAFAVACTMLFTASAGYGEGGSNGIYEVYLNGKRVGDDYFNPGVTQYNKTHLYRRLM